MNMSSRDYKQVVVALLIMGFSAMVFWVTTMRIYLVNSSYHSTNPRSAIASPRILFFVFPQWHSIPENNRIHGWDFTDWSLVKHMSQVEPKIKTLQLPTELGWYNLLSYYVRKRQSELLREYGGFGFIYHIYWFTDHPVMDEPMRQMLADKDINIPYIVTWANENWIDRWAGGDYKVIISINISALADRRKFFNYLLPYFRDSRYIRVQGKPVFQVYQRDSNMDLVFQDFKRWATEAGLSGLHCHQLLAHFHRADFDPSLPQNFRVPVSNLSDGVTEFQPNFIKKWSSQHFLSTVHIPRHHPLYHWRGLHIDWDDGPRHKKYSSERSHPFYFERHLREVIRTMQSDTRKNLLAPEDQYVTINAWNEWSEGNTIEPSNIYGRGYLEAMQIVTTKRVEDSKVCILLAGSNAKTSFGSLSITLDSLQSHLTAIEWEVLVYSTDLTREKPLELMNYIRNTSEHRIRMIDMPFYLQQRNTTGHNVLRYLLPHCHEVRNSHYVIFLRAGNQLTAAPRSPSDWEAPWFFPVLDFNSITEWRTAERMGLLETSEKLTLAYASKWSPYNATYTSGVRSKDNSKTQG